MASLKACCENLAPLLGLSPAALYERQRALIRIGELPEPTKGRGHGLAATAETVAVLVSAVMITDNLSDTDARVHQLGKARSRPRCQLTGTTFFADALSAVFASREHASKVSRIRVFRGELAALIHFFPEDPRPIERPFVGREPEVTQFGRFREYPDQMAVEANLWSPVVERIEQLLRSTREEQT
jgi:hypothetical protein